MDATDLHLMTGSYVLGALDEPDQHAFKAHLAECTACTQEVRELEATAALLGSAEAVAPPARLRARVLAETRAIPQRGGVEPAAADLAAAVGGDDASPLRRRLPAVTAVAAVLLVVVSLVLGAWALSLRRTEQRLSAEASRIGTVLTAPDAATTSGSLTSGGQGAVVSPVPTEPGCSSARGSRVPRPGGPISCGTSTRPGQPGRPVCSARRATDRPSCDSTVAGVVNHRRADARSRAAAGRHPPPRPSSRCRSRASDAVAP